jgi:hypothetical protein
MLDPFSKVVFVQYLTYTSTELEDMRILKPESCNEMKGIYITQDDSRRIERNKNQQR